MITVMKQHLQEALKGLAKVVCSKTTLPILACVRIKSENDMLTVSGTDLEQWLEYRLPFTGKLEPLDCIIQFEALKNFINGSDGKNMLCIEMAATDSVRLSMEIAGQRMERSFEVMPVDDWPTCLQHAGDMSPVPKEIFNLIRQALPAASKDVSRKILSGVFLEKDGITATDGKHIVRLGCDIPVKEPVVLPPAKVLSTGLFKDAGMFAVTIKDKEATHAHFSSGRWRYTLKCVEGNYPNYHQVIPDAKLLKNRITFTAEDVAVLKKSLPMLDNVDDDLNAVVLYAGSKGVKFLSRKPGSDVKLETKAGYDGISKELLAGMNRDYILRAFDLGFIEVRFSDAYSPFVFSSESGIFEFMPIRNMPDMEMYCKKLGITLNKEENQMKTRTEVTAPQTATAAAPRPVEQKPAFQVVGGTQENGEVFEEASTAIDTLKASIKTIYDGVADLQRKIKDAQKAIKNKEREYQSTKQLITKLRTASGF